MTRLALLVVLTLALPAAAEPLDDPLRAQAAWLQAEQQRRLERAQQRCILHRGVDCQSPEGLEEWLLLDRSRAEAVLDRVAPITVLPPPVYGGGSASTGGSSPGTLPAPAAR